MIILLIKLKPEKKTLKRTDPYIYKHYFLLALLTPATFYRYLPPPLFKKS